jgi:hypothetical protein
MLGVYTPPVRNVIVLEKQYFYEHYQKQSYSERTPGVWISFIAFIQGRYEAVFKIFPNDAVIVLNLTTKLM